MASPRILVIKHGALGDIVQGLDAFAGLRAGHPHAHIALLTSSPFMGLARRMPWFDEVIEDPRAPVVKLGQAFRLREMFRNGWDMMIDLQCSRRTARYHRFLAPAGNRWFGTASGASDPYPDFTGVNNADRMKTAIAMAGGDAATVADLAWLADAAAVPAHCASATILVPGCSASKPQKRWPAQSFADIARREMSAGRTVVITGTAADREAADIVTSLAPGCIDLVGRTDLPGLAALFAGAGAVIGNDTGPVFLAARSDVPTLMIMGNDTDPSMSAPVGALAGWVRKTRVGDVSADEAATALADLRAKARTTIRAG
ncbi:MAG: glycosyltransferase family 9 protein [Candidatus Puniceispirillaceae bacterium]